MSLQRRTWQVFEIPLFSQMIRQLSVGHQTELLGHIQGLVYAIGSSIVTCISSVPIVLRRYSLGDVQRLGRRVACLDRATSFR
jgi:hypothetical protein